MSGKYVNCTWDLEELCGEKQKKRIEDGDLLRVKLAVLGSSCSRDYI